MTFCVLHGKNNISRVRAANEILLLPLEHKIHIFSPPCNILYLLLSHIVRHSLKSTPPGNLAIWTVSCIGKSIMLIFLSSSRNKFTLLKQHSVTDVSVGFRPPCWYPSGWAPTWRLHTNLYKFGWHTSANSARIKNSRDLILGEVVVYIAIIYHIPDSWIYLFNGYDF